MSRPTLAADILTPFLAGFLAVAVVHQPLVQLAVSAGLAPEVWEAWSDEPVPPFDVPMILSRMFWGGVWAVPFHLLLRDTRGARYWLGWIAGCALVPTLAAIYVVPVLKGGAPLDFWTRFPPGVVVNAAWGAGIAALLKAVRMPRPPPPA